MPAVLTSAQVSASPVPTSSFAPQSGSSSSASSSIAVVYKTSTVTFTVLSVPTSPSSQRQTSTLPSGIVAGAVVGGVVLAVVLVFGWTYWAKRLHRKRDQHVCISEDVVFVSLIGSSQCTTLTTNKRSRRSSRHPRVTYRKNSSAYSTDSEQDIIGAPFTDEKDDNFDRQATIPNSPTKSVLKTSDTASKPVNFKKSTRRTLRKKEKPAEFIRKNPPLSPIIDVDHESLEPMSPTQSSISDAPPGYITPSLDSPPNVIHKPSTIGSASVYSTQSGEERHTDIDQNLVTAALGLPRPADSLITRPPPASISISHKPSNISSIYSNQSGEDRQYAIPSHLMNHNQRRFSGWTRSSGSLYSAMEEQLFNPPARHTIGGKAGAGPSSRLSQFSFHSPGEIGLAYGGDEETV